MVWPYDVGIPRDGVAVFQSVDALVVAGNEVRNICEVSSNKRSTIWAVHDAISVDVKVADCLKFDKTLEFFKTENNNLLENLVSQYFKTFQFSSNFANT